MLPDERRPPAPPAHRGRPRRTARTTATLVLLALLAGCGRHLPPGRVARHAPVQEPVAEDARPFRFRDCTVTPLARFHVEARVLSTARYRIDRGAHLAPVDLALGWGPMSDSQVLEDLSITQMARYYMWSGRELPLEREQITANSANMHMIPADDAVRHTLLGVRRDDVVRFSGWLVRMEADDGWTWQSSLSRDDTGDGSCELVFVDSLATE